MRRRLATLATAATLVVPVADAAAATTRTAAVKKIVVTKRFTGTTAEADRWGTVRVTVVVRKTTTIANGRTKVTRRYTNLTGSYTYHTDRSQFIMSQALPVLRQEFLQAQSANVQLVSGATYTSEAFVQSLQSAIAQAKKA
jgi:uncharacterized protein with FMN-binding domain